MLSIKNLTKIYKIKGGNDTVALNHVNIDFPEKGMVFLLGKSGSGKSTLLNLIGGLDFPTDGEIILKGRSSKDFSQSDFDSYRNTYIGFIFQEYNILNEFNVEQNIALAIELQGKKVSKEAVDSLLEQVDLTGYGKRKPNTLSGGQKQRIAIARALIKEPNIIMADEPTGALDSKTGEQVFETLKKLSSDKLVIVVSHDRDFAERFGDRIIELKDGQILSDQTKHMVESTSISENVTIINEHAIKINDAKKLTKKDFDQLYESIKNSEGKVFISSGDNADKSMKVARISEDGRSDTFKETKDIELKQYDGSQTTFIRSKMPISKSTKMGLSSLKTKPVRLVFTMLLSVVSFTMFGVASGLMLYNPNHTYSEALGRTDYTAEVIEKMETGRETHQTLNANGDVIDEWSYDYQREVKFGVSEIAELNKNNLGLVYIPVSRVYSIPSFSDYTMEKNSSFYNQYYRLTSLSEVSEEEFNRLGYHLDGTYPTEDDEIIIPKIYGEMLIDSGAIKKNSYHDAIGAKLSFNGKASSEKLTITGFYDTGAIPSDYMQLADEDSKLSPQEKVKLSENFANYFTNSFNSVGFVTPAAYQKYRDNTSSGYRSVPTVWRQGIYLSESDEEPTNIADHGGSFITEQIVEDNRSLFEFYNLNEEKIENFTIKDDEIYLGKARFEQMAYSVRDSFFNDFMTMNNNDSIMKYMPSYHEVYNDPNNQTMIDNYKTYTYSNKDAIREFLSPYTEEFEKAYKIANFLNQYVGTVSYDSLSASQREMIESIKDAPNVYATQAQVDEIYQILYDNFDEARPNFLTKNYLDQAYSYNDKARMKIENDSILYEAYCSNPSDWSNATAEHVKNFLNENCKDGITPTYHYWLLYLGGYTFKDYHPVNNQVLKPRSDLTFNYTSYNGTSGKLKVVGYYVCDGDSWSPLVSENFLKLNSMANDDEGTTSRTISKTEYVEPADAKYYSVMVKTDYTQEQVEFMLNCKVKGAKYSFTSNAYRQVNFIVEMISVLKNVFFWTGVGFGVFSALMMLNFITISIASKKKDIGILRAIGARKSDVFKIFFSESLFIATVCTVLSLIFTFITEFFLDRYFVDQIGISILQFSLVTVGLVVAVSLVIAVIATIIPVLHSSKKPPVESIRAL